MTDKTDSKEREAMVREICRAVAELPDRNSPEDWPEAMLVTHEELADILRASLAASAGSEPVAFLVCTEEGDPDMVFLSQHDAQQYLEDHERPTPLYTHPSPPEGMVGGWMPIETAPKDGRFLVRDGVWYGEVASESKLSDVALVQRENGGAFDVSDTDYYSACIVNPTGWMPLPPTTSAGSGKGD